MLKPSGQDPNIPIRVSPITLEDGCACVETLPVIVNAKLHGYSVQNTPCAAIRWNCSARGSKSQFNIVVWCLLQNRPY
eukprot:5253424-Pyramimonas_sp.AAC.1